MIQRLKKFSGLFDYTDPTGEYHRGKTIWDFFQLFLVPAVLILGAYCLDQSAKARSEAIENDRAREMILQNYFMVMKELMLRDHLRVSSEASEVRTVARSLTQSALRSLDGERKGLLIAFLSEAQLIGSTEKGYPIINLWGSDLSDANLTDIYLMGADLSNSNLTNARMNHAKMDNIDLFGANLTKADLTGAFLSDADLRKAILTGADLSGATLRNAILEEANLSGATINYEQLAEVETLFGATMPDGNKFDPSIHKFQETPITP